MAIVFLAVLLFVLTRQWCPAKESESPEEASACLGAVGEPGSLHVLVDSWFKAGATEVRLSRENSRAPILTNRMEMGRHYWDVSLNVGEVEFLTLLFGSNSGMHCTPLCFVISIYKMRNFQLFLTTSVPCRCCYNEQRARGGQNGEQGGRLSSAHPLQCHLISS